LNVKNRIRYLYTFFRFELWELNLKEQKGFKKHYYKQLRILAYAIRGFIKDKCPLHASALTFYSLLSIIPIAALVFGISKGFGLQESIKQKLLTEFPEHSGVVQWIVKFADSLLEISQSGLVTGIGIILLLWAAVKVLGNIEESLNTIWTIKRSRTFIRKFSDYLSIMIIGPIFFFVSSSVAVYVASQATDLTQNNTYFNLINPLIFFFIKLIPYVLIWILFTLMYMIIPNTKVKLTAAVFGSFIAGTLYQWTQWFYLEFQIGASRYNALYGSFAALPLFLIWLQLSWFIVLLGAELSFAFQNVPHYLHEKVSSQTSLFYKNILLLNIAYIIIKNFEKGNDALSQRKIAEVAEVPEPTVKETLDLLVKSKIINKIDRGKRYSTFQPAKDIHQITIQDILTHIANAGKTNPLYIKQEIPQKLLAKLESFEKELLNHPQNILLKDL